MRTVKIPSLYPVEVDAAWKVPSIEPRAVRAGGQLLLYETNYLPAQHIVYDERYHGAFGQVEKNLRRWIEGIGEVWAARFCFIDWTVSGTAGRFGALGLRTISGLPGPNYRPDEHR